MSTSRVNDRANVKQPPAPPVSTIQMHLPTEVYRLEEINIPSTLADQLAGETAAVDVLPEEQPFTREADLSDSPVLIARDGTVWNDYRPARLSFKDENGRRWNLPRHWTRGPLRKEELRQILLTTLRYLSNDSVQGWTTPECQVFKECQFIETVHLPSVWDLMDINIPYDEADRAAGRATQVTVHLKPDEQTRVYWCDSLGNLWRIPHDWRRRRIRLPDFDTLAAQQIPEGVAERFSGAVVSVNYHPGSLCCLKDGFRFRDEYGRRWPVRKQDCLVLGFGSESEALA